MNINKSKLQVYYNHLTLKIFTSNKTEPTPRQGPVPQKVVKFNPGLSQISSKVFLSKNMSLYTSLQNTVTCVFTSRFSDENIEFQPKQCIGK